MCGGRQAELTVPPSVASLQVDAVSARGASGDPTARARCWGNRTGSCSSSFSTPPASRTISNLITQKIALRAPRSGSLAPPRSSATAHRKRATMPMPSLLLSATAVGTISAAPHPRAARPVWSESGRRGGVSGLGGGGQPTAKRAPRRRRGRPSRGRGMSPKQRPGAHRPKYKSSRAVNRPAVRSESRGLGSR